MTNLVHEILALVSLTTGSTYLTRHVLEKLTMNMPLEALAD